jgi:hypothetical protein
MKRFTADQIAEARGVLERAEAALGSLSIGQATDLFLDNFSWLFDVREAKSLLFQVMEKES